MATDFSNNGLNYLLALKIMYWLDIAVDLITLPLSQGASSNAIDCLFVEKPLALRRRKGMPLAIVNVLKSRLAVPALGNMMGLYERTGVARHMQVAT